MLGFLGGLLELRFLLMLFCSALKVAANSLYIGAKCVANVLGFRRFQIGVACGWIYNQQRGCAFKYNLKYGFHLLINSLASATLITFAVNLS